MSSTEDPLQTNGTATTSSAGGDGPPDPERLAELTVRLLAQDERRHREDDDAQHHHHANDEEEDDDDPHETTSESPSSSSSPAPGVVVAGAVANLCSATLGAGVLALPHAAARAGVACGVVALAAAACATTASIDLLTDAMRAYRRPSYETLTRHVLGPSVETSVRTCLVVFCLGCAVAYLIAVADVLENAGLLLRGDDRDATLCVVWMTVCVPLSLLRRMRTLQAASAVGVAAIGTLLFATVVHLIQHLHDGYEHHHDQDDHDDDEYNNVTTMAPTPDNETTWWEQESLLSNTTTNNNTSFHVHDWHEVWWPLHGYYSVLQACPVILFAFSCQVNVCAIFLELPVTNHNDNDNDGDDDDGASTPQRLLYHASKVTLMRRVTRDAVLLCTVLYAGVAATTLADFGPHAVRPNVLDNYDIGGDGGIMQVAAAGMAVAVLMAFPLNIFPARVTCTTTTSSSSSCCGPVTGRRRRRYDDDDNARRRPVADPDLTVALLEDSYYDEQGRIMNEDPDYGYEEIVPDAEMDEDNSKEGENNNNDDDNGDNHGDEEEQASQLETLANELAPVMPTNGDEPEASGNGNDDDDNNNNNDGDQQEGFEDEYNDDTPLDTDWVTHVVWTMILTSTALGLALVVPNISVVFSVLGGTTSSWLGFCVPGLLGLHLERDAEQKSWSRYLVSWGLLLGGIAVGILTTVLTVQSIVHPHRWSH